METAKTKPCKGDDSKAAPYHAKKFSVVQTKKKSIKTTKTKPSKAGGDTNAASVHAARSSTLQTKKAEVAKAKHCKGGTSKAAPVHGAKPSKVRFYTSSNLI